MKRFALLICFAVMVGWLPLAATVAQDDPAPVPTLVPPTPIPVSGSGAQDVLLTESTVARIQRDGVVRIGILYNAPPFGELNIQGEVTGYDAALGRSMAGAWGVEAQFVQVTQQSALTVLLSGEIDMLLAAQVHRREVSTTVEFSQAYFQGSMAMMVRTDDGVESLQGMANRRVGVVMGTPSESAVAFWQQRSGAAVTIQRYLTIDQAIVALVNGEVDGVVDKRYLLRQLINPDLTRVMEDTVQPEPYVAVLRRQDVNMRNLVNRTLQHLAQSGRLAEIHSEFFPARPYPEDTVTLWQNIGEEAPTPDQYGTDVPYPQQYAVPRVQSSGVLRVAGRTTAPPEAQDADRRLAQVNAQLAGQMAVRWGVNVEFVPGTEDDPIRAVEDGRADIAVGVPPDWNLSDRIDFAGTYLLRGKRLLTTVQDDYNSFNDLRGQWIGIYESEPEAEDLVRELAQSVNTTSINLFKITAEEDAMVAMLEENNVDAIFGDSIRLLPHLEAYPDTVKLSTRCPLCDPWYTREYMAVAVPRNDIDFRLLVQYTLQEMSLDGTLDDILTPVTVPGEELAFTVFPGPSDFLGFSLAQ